MGLRDTLPRVAPLALASLALAPLAAACSAHRVQSGPGESTGGHGESADGTDESTDVPGDSIDGSGDSTDGFGDSVDPVDCATLDGSDSEPTEYRQVAAAQTIICALTDIGSIRCWSDGANYLEADPEAINDRCFRRIAVGGGWGASDFVCGLDEEGRPHCTMTATNGVSETPAVALTSLVAGGDFACGLDGEGNATCWWVPAGPEPDHNIEAREGLMAGGPYEQIAAGWEVACGLSRGGKITCFGQDRYGEASAVPTGTFDRVFAFGLNVCGLDTAGALQCWGTITDDPYEAVVPDVEPGDPEIVDVSGDLYGLCWRSADGMLDCSGSAPYESVTGGPFDQMDGGLSAICGLEPDGGVVCTHWDGDGWTAPE